MIADHFADRLLEAIEVKRSHVVVGLDPDYESLPAEVRAAHPRDAYGSDEEMKAAAYREFLEGILDGVWADAVAVKIQCAYFEALGWRGYELYQGLIGPAKERGCLVIADAKRGDIGSTAEAYAKAHLDVTGADAITVSPYLGGDSVEPFLTRARGHGKGVFVLVKTSNPGSVDLQDQELATGVPLYQRVAELVGLWGHGSEGARGYRAVGAVVGGTHPVVGARLRALLPGVPLLIPGYGAQGATAADLAGMFDDRGTGAVVNSSRAVLYAYRKRPGVSWVEAARLEVREMKEALWKVAGRG
jgi:orotidine-5'-phosphate decarboxylase